MLVVCSNKCGTFSHQVLGPELEELGRMVEDMTGLYPKEGRLLRQPATGDYCAACFEVGKSVYTHLYYHCQKLAMWPL